MENAPRTRFWNKASRVWVQHFWLWVESSTAFFCTSCGPSCWDHSLWLDWMASLWNTMCRVAVTSGLFLRTVAERCDADVSYPSNASRAQFRRPITHNACRPNGILVFCRCLILCLIKTFRTVKSTHLQTLHFFGIETLNVSLSLLLLILARTLLVTSFVAKICDLCDFLQSQDTCSIFSFAFLRVDLFFASSASVPNTKHVNRPTVSMTIRHIHRRVLVCNHQAFRTDCQPTVHECHQFLKKTSFNQMGSRTCGYLRVGWIYINWLRSCHFNKVEFLRAAFMTLPFLTWYFSYIGTLMHTCTNCDNNTRVIFTLTSMHAYRHILTYYVNTLCTYRYMSHAIHHVVHRHRIHTSKSGVPCTVFSHGMIPSKVTLRRL